MNTRYQQKLQRQFIKSSMAPLVVCLILFVVGLFAYTIGYNRYSLNEWSHQTEAGVNEIYSYYSACLQDEDAQETMVEFIDGKISDRMLTYSFRTACHDEPASCELLLLDSGGKQIYYSGESRDYSPHLAYYIQLLYDGSIREEGCVSRVYYLRGDYAKWIITLVLRDAGGQPLGQASILLDESNLDKALRHTGCEVVLTDGSGLAALSTAPKLLDSRHYFFLDDSGQTKSSEDSYRVRQSYISELNGWVYTLVEVQNWTGYYMLGCMALLLIAFLMIVQSRKFARQLADSSAQSLEKLYSEFALVQGDPDHRISIDSDDEFSEISGRINSLISDVNELNKKSLALERSRNDMERAQIKSRLHPHFIYNTLESIRFSILMKDDAEANRMILKLTGLLRYSIDNTSSYITLEEDMEHVKEYLDIMRFRYGERFTYDFNIADDTKSFLLPPLFIQPLLENSLKYGFATSERVHISVDTHYDGEALRIRVADNGAGMNAAQLEEQRRKLVDGDAMDGHFGIGLVYRSLKLQYGPESSIELDSAPGRGLTVELRLGKRVADDEL